MESWFNATDAYYFHNGVHYELYQKLGAHLTQIDGRDGCMFAVYAPAAESVSLIGDFNYWNPDAHPMQAFFDSGVYTLFLPGVGAGTRYKFSIRTRDGRRLEKADPYAFFSELRPCTASVVFDLGAYRFHDEAYRQKKSYEDFRREAMAVYEVHLGSFRRDTEGNVLSYRQLARELASYLSYMGYTHVELMGIPEYPYDPSWGYQVTGYFSPTARYGDPSDFMYLVDHLHQNGIGVILDWVPAHFPKDLHGLAEFDGTPLYEYGDPLKAEYPEWGTYAFDHGKKEISNFLIASALFWIREYHLDALRVDAVAAMLYHDFSRPIYRPNIYGGTLNLESVEFFRHLSSILRLRTDGYLIAEDSSGIPGITADVTEGGLGFGLKWNMGWMNDTLRYMEKDPIYRSYHHDWITHTVEYAFTEQYILPLSHDEVVYGKGSLLAKFPGNQQDKLGGLRSLFTLFFGFPGKKLLFMGQDFGEVREWDYNGSLDFSLTRAPGHRELWEGTRSLLTLYRTSPVLYAYDKDPGSFQWINGGDRERSIFAFLRKRPEDFNGCLLFVLNFAPVGRDPYEVGVPLPGDYRRVYSTYPDTEEMTLAASSEACDGLPYRLTFALRPQESVIFAFPWRSGQEFSEK